jgi:hypothetical protein
MAVRGGWPRTAMLYERLAVLSRQPGVVVPRRRAYLLTGRPSISAGRALATGCDGDLFDRAGERLQATTNGGGTGQSLDTEATA